MLINDPRDVLTRAVRGPDATLAYGPDVDHLAEAWWPSRSVVPAGSPPALILIIHGGFWQMEWDRRHARPLASALADEGYVVGSVEYRRVGSPGVGGWPETFDDIAAAVDRLPQMIMATAPAHVRSEGVVLVGHSAGGHLALWAAARHRLPSDLGWHVPGPSRVRGVVALAPVAALSRSDRERVGDDAVAQLVGGHADQVPERYALVDPIALAPSGVPTVIVHGQEDQQVPIELSRFYVQKARSAGDPVTMIELAAMEHFGLIDPLSAAWVSVLDAVRGVAGSVGHEDR